VKPPVLVLDGHTTQALACVRSLGRAGYPVYVAGVRRWPLAAASRHCRGSRRLDGETLTSFTALRAWARRRGIRLVLPLTERSCLLCVADAAAWRADGIELGCGPEDMLLGAFDKAQSLRRAAELGIAIPPSRFPTSLPDFGLAAQELGYPCVVKARFSYAWHDGVLLADPGVAYVASPNELTPAVLARRQGPHWPLIQRYVPGSGKGVFALCDHGDPVAWFAHQRLRDVRPSGSGSSLRRSVPIDPRLQQLAVTFLKDRAWHGPAMLEFRDDGVTSPWLMEVNGRFWGSLQLAIAAGVDLPLLWVRILTQQPIAAPSGFRPDVTLRWLWGDMKRLLFIAAGPPTGFPGPYPRLWQGLREVFGPQPAGTHSETWDVHDPWPALAEWVQGLAELVSVSRPQGRRFA
jgi:predicted ATP-grasp superfamily ATP-dependent carboligase